jgi:hypothetical protein
VSGNPAGRVKGSFNRATILAQTLLGREAGKLARKAVEMALAGDATALRICLERLVPIIRAGSIRITLPPIRAASDIAVAMNVVVEAVAGGMISLDDGERLVGLLDRQRIVLETPDLELRLRELEHQYREMSLAQMAHARSDARPNGRGV